VFWIRKYFFGSGSSDSLCWIKEPYPGLIDNGTARSGSYLDKFVAIEKTVFSNRHWLVLILSHYKVIELVFEYLWIFDTYIVRIRIRIPNNRIKDPGTRGHLITDLLPDPEPQPCKGYTREGHNRKYGNDFAFQGGGSFLMHENPDIVCLQETKVRMVCALN
jgi:hypothetical protein